MVLVESRTRSRTRWRSLRPRLGCLLHVPFATPLARRCFSALRLMQLGRLVCTQGARGRGQAVGAACCHPGQGGQEGGWLAREGAGCGGQVPQVWRLCSPTEGLRGATQSARGSACGRWRVLMGMCWWGGRQRLCQALFGCTDCQAACILPPCPQADLAALDDLQSGLSGLSAQLSDLEKVGEGQGAEPLPAPIKV